MSARMRISTLWMFCLLVLFCYTASVCDANPQGKRSRPHSRHAFQRQPPILLALNPNGYSVDIEWSNQTHRPETHVYPNAKWLQVKGRNFRRGASLLIEDPGMPWTGSSGRKTKICAEFISSTELRVPIDVLIHRIEDSGAGGSRRVKISIVNPGRKGFVSYPGLFTYSFYSQAGG